MNLSMVFSCVHYPSTVPPFSGGDDAERAIRRRLRDSLASGPDRGSSEGKSISILFGVVKVGLPFKTFEMPSEVMVRRSREQILVGILKSCCTKGVLVSHLLSSENLSYRLLRSYLDRLLVSELIWLDSEGDRTSIRTTDRGLEVLRCFGNGVALLNGLVATCPLFHPASRARSILA